jgi:hypothetical protein
MAFMPTIPIQKTVKILMSVNVILHVLQKLRVAFV